MNWTNDEISRAFTLKGYSEQCYLYLRDNLQYPLPSLSTLKECLSKSEANAMEDSEESFSYFLKRLKLFNPVEDKLAKILGRWAQ